MNFPVIVTLITSLKSARRDLSANPGLWCRAPTLANYAEVLSRTDRLRHLRLSLEQRWRRPPIGSGLALFLALPAAYAIARGDCRRSDAAAARHQSARGAADHLRDPALS